LGTVSLKVRARTLLKGEIVTNHWTEVEKGPGVKETWIDQRETHRRSNLQSIGHETLLISLLWHPLFPDFFHMMLS
jgi:hypothetical protein